MFINIDIKEFLRENGVEYVEKGSNVKRGNVNVKCPWCGDSDPSQHLGIHLDKGWYACWRSREHRGKNLARLLAQLTSISYRQLKGIVYGDKGLPVDPDSYESLADGEFFRSDESIDERPMKLFFDTSFRALGVTPVAYGAEPFISYLCGRGFSTHCAIALSRRFRLQYCFKGYWKNRIVIPVYEDNKLVTWTARTIRKLEPRYLALRDSDSVQNIYDCLYNFDAAMKRNGKTLLLMEGPVDVWKIRMFGLSFPGITAVCRFGLTWSYSQLSLLQELSKRYKRVIVVPDSGAEQDAAIVADEIRPIFNNNAYTVPLPDGVEDVGAMNEQQVVLFLKKVAEV